MTTSSGFLALIEGEWRRLLIRLLKAVGVAGAVGVEGLESDEFGGMVTTNGGPCGFGNAGAASGSLEGCSTDWTNPGGKAGRSTSFNPVSLSVVIL